MTSDIEDKLMNHGDINFKVIRVSDGGIKNNVFGNILLVIRTYLEESKEYIVLKIMPLTAAAANAAANSKLSINKFEVTIDHADHTISLGPAHGVSIEVNLQNKGIGGFVLNEMLAILRRRAPNYNFILFEITMPEGTTQTEKEMLIAFFGKVGINFSFLDTEQRIGTLRASPPASLTSYYNQNKILEMDTEKFLHQMVLDRTKSESEINTLKTEMSRMGDETFAGIPKKQLVRYTLITCGVTLLLILILIL
jgi:hypothetical protein